MKKLVFILMPLLLFLNSFNPVATADTENEIFSLRHDGKNNYFEYVMEAGEEGCISFTLKNISISESTNHILLYDSLTAINGGNVIMTPENYLSSQTASWFASNHFEESLASGETREVSINFKVPDDVSNGVYTAILALYSYSKDSAEQGGNVILEINNNYTSTLAIVIRIGEETEGNFLFGENIELNMNKQGGRSYIMIPVENNGSSYGFPAVEYSLSDSAGGEISKGRIDMDIFYRKTDSFAAMPVDNAIFSKGSYILEVEMNSKTSDKLFDRAKYTINMDSRTVRKAVKNTIEAKQMDKQNDFWKEDFVVLGKRELVFAGAGISGVLIGSIMFLLLMKRRKIN